jgi:hypothetical protein
MAAEVSDRMLEVLDAIRQRLTPAEAMRTLGMSRSHFNTTVRRLRDRGVIRRREDLPQHAVWSEEYPYEVTGEPVVYRPAIPPDARLRLAYPVDSQRDLTVPPVRHVRWDRWSVQGVPVLNFDGSSGRRASDLVPEWRVVVVADLDHPEPEEVQVFLASTHHRWSESVTDRLGWDGEDRWEMTLVIACAVGVEAIMDMADLAGKGDV